jgi:hypothetical protein
MTIEELLGHSKKQYVAKIGNTFLVSPMSEDICESMSDEQTDKCFLDFPSEMINCLKNTPNVVRHTPTMDSELMGAFYIRKHFDEEGENRKVTVYEASGLAPNFFDFLEFQVLWPRKNQDIPSWDSRQAIENFTVLYDGAIFLAYGESPEIGDPSYAWPFGLEAMKVIRSCFEKSKLWQITRIGPIMLHPAIYFIFVDNRTGLTLPTVKVKEDNWYVFFAYENDGHCAEVINDFFYEIKYEVKEHYGNMLLRDEILSNEFDFRDEFQALSLLYRTLLSLRSWSPSGFIRRPRYVKQLRIGIGEAYEAYVELMELQASIAAERSRMRAALLQNPFLKEVSVYFDDVLSDVGNTDLSPIIQGLHFLEEETRMVTIGRSNIEAGLVGAVAAAAIYAITSAIVG